ncbi:hypothetical protein L1987_19040 [Smallanthus sonchifolius]|uniref:Uncharacterized protein n=1 Tax=Smallanthus sonchifolius TaxID=185202 RepID=A0ACB9J1V6_9ASTR|nr:hypothetical protein L1987_19040 [Smallanthus sonchifolius]
MHNLNLTEYATIFITCQALTLPHPLEIPTHRHFANSNYLSTITCSRLVPLGLCFLVLFHGCLALLIEQITSREANRRQVSEAGFSEFWDSGEQDELECAGVQVVRHTINPKGLLLPYNPSTPELVYVVKVFREQWFLDVKKRLKHRRVDQRVYRYKEGDILALPAGAVHWTYNDGDTPIVVVALRDTSNVANQLDRNFRKFFLAGNPQSQHLQQQPTRSTGLPNEQEPPWGQRDHPSTGKQPPRRSSGQQQQRERGRDNGIEQTICSTQLSANIASPALADVYNPRGGRISSLNSHKLPVLNWLQLSAERVVLYKNAVLAPHYNLNAHSIIYIISGSSRLQIVRNDGSAMFDGVAQEGQLIVVPQDFAVIKKAGEEGCEWVAFKTNDNAITTQLAGRFSYIRALPEDVLANSYGISRQEAKNLKYSRKEGVVLSPRSTSRSPLVELKNAVLDALFG